MKILTGYLQPTEGTAFVAGHDVVEAPLAVQAELGYLPENAPLYLDMAVQEYLLMMAELRGLAHAAPVDQRAGGRAQALRGEAVAAHGEDQVLARHRRGVEADATADRTPDDGDPLGKGDAMLLTDEDVLDRHP